MNIQFTFKKMSSSQALSELFAEKLLSRISKFTRRPAHGHVTFSLEGLLQKIHVTLITADGRDIEAEHSGEDMYPEIDVVIEKVVSQLRKHKERMREHKRTSNKYNVIPIRAAATREEETIDASDILKFEAARHRPTDYGKASSH